VRVIRLGTRGSALARWQSEHVAARLATESPDLRVTIVQIESAGDRMGDVPLSHVEGTGFFTATLERALLAGDVDVAVHSHKDLPIDATPGLVVAAVAARGPAEDVLIARDGLRLDTLPPGARVGTCSARRTAQVLAIRPDVSIVPLRGNVPTRIAKVTGGHLDAIVLARAGLVRLGLERHLTQVFAINRMLPAPAQGALAVQCRADDGPLRSLLSALNDEATRRVVHAERSVLHALGGGCSVPVGALARPDGLRLTLTAGVFGRRGRTSVRVDLDGHDPQSLGETAAARLLALGGGEILAEFDRAARIDAIAVGGLR
jgi:hydroxymethylbilane synthase